MGPVAGTDSAASSTSPLQVQRVGVRPPTPTWGNMIMDGKDVLLTAPWVALAPGLALVVTVVAFNLAADGLRDALDPRMAG